MITSAGGGAPIERSIERFRDVVAQRFGLHFDDGKLPFLEQLLRRRVEAGPRTDEAYLDALENDPADTELAVLATELTVPETYFFRNKDQLHAFSELCLPARLKERASRAAGRPRLRLLSAGCASGEEAYSLAILLHEHAASILPIWDVSIVGIDINPAVLAKAERARYSSWALRDTDEATKARWFRSEGRDAVLKDAARTLVRFERRNLHHDDARFWTPESTDVVFCRNVLMYMTPEAARAVMARITRTLVPGGYLFMGHAETLRGLSHDFHLCHTHDTFYYQRKDGPPGRAGSDDDVLPRRGPDGGVDAERDRGLVLAVDSAESWVDVIQKASDRIQALTLPSLSSLPVLSGVHAGSATADAPALPRPATSIAPGLELLRSERFGDALAFVHSLPPEAASDPTAMLLHAVLLTHANRLPEAEALCNALLAIDDLDAGAHYVLALCREGAGDGDGAAEHDRLATYLDPAFAMPRLHLGLLARRRGDPAAARRELGEALALLRREDPARVLLFGGGFGREALVTLCRAELLASGGGE